MLIIARLPRGRTLQLEAEGHEEVPLAALEPFVKLLRVQELGRHVVDLSGSHALKEVLRLTRTVTLSTCNRFGVTRNS